MRRSNDGLYRRENQIFAFRYKDRDGKWRERYTGTTNRAEAKSARENFLDQLKRNQVPAELAKRAALQAVDEWLKSMGPDDLSQNTIRSYRTCLNPVTAFFGSRKLASITSADLRTYRSKRKQAGRANRTVNHELLCFSYVLKEAKLWKNLCDDYKPLPEGTKHSTRRPLTLDELNKLVRTAIGNPQWEVAFNVMLIAANTTCRPCEISGLQLGRVHLEAAYPYITISRLTTKTNAGERDIPLNRVAQLAIRRLCDRAYKLGSRNAEHYLLPADLSKHTKPSDPLYSRRQEGFDPNLHQRGWDTAWSKLRAKAGLPSVQFYQLRHTSITAGAEENVPLAVMKALAGHMDEKMTEYYTGVRDNPKAKAVTAIENANPELLSILGLEEEVSESRIN